MPSAPTHQVRTHVGGLLWTVVRTDFKSRYHGTLGGFIWALLKPLAMFVVLYSVFSFVFQSDARYRLNLIVGLFLYEFFSESTKSGLISLFMKGYLLSKARFPSWIVVVASCANAAITLTVFLAFLLIYQTATGHPPSAAGLGLLVLYVLAFAVMSVGFSLATSVLYLRYRDLNQIWDVLVQAGFFLAPVVYPLSTLPERYHAYLYLWLPTPVIQFTRAVIVDGVSPSLRGHLFLAAEAACVLAIGLLVFRRLAPRAAEYL
jgi:lipopolysaccharide transport system permease protein